MESFPQSAKNRSRRDQTGASSAGPADFHIQSGRRPSKRSPPATAFPHREKGYSILIIAQWRDRADSDRNIVWARETYDRLLPCSREGAYSNYMDDDEDMARVRQAFGGNFARLQRLKDRYDPTNVFHRNQDIPPSDST